jgi:type I restriction enzyme S subunit
MTFEGKRLGDVAEIIGGGTPSTRDSDNWDGDIPWLTPKDLSSFEGIYVTGGARSLTEVGLRISSAKILPVGTVLYTSRAPIGYVAIASHPISTNQGFKSLVLREGYVPEFVFYLLKASKSEIEAHASGGTFAEISAKALSDVVLQFPPLVQQQAIARVLLLLDEKIQINIAVSKTLGDIAQTIFKSWFIDFDPVKAKMAGEKPVGMDDVTAALFPDSLEDSELGMIPRGWLVEEFGSVSNLLMGQSPPGDTYNEDGAGLPFYQGKTDFGARFPRRRVYCSSGNRVASAGETLISVRAPVGDLNQATEKCVIGRGVASALHKSGSQSYSFSLLTSLQLKLAYYNGEGTVFGAINKFDFQSMKVVEPSKSVLTEFDQLTNPINEQIRTLFLQTVVLTALRDSLLPRLISGELQIPEEMLVT